MPATEADPPSHAHRVELVRPGPSSLAWLVRAVNELQQRDPLRRVSVVASPYLAAIAKRALAEHGCANVRTVLPRQLASIVAGRAGPGAPEELTGVLEGAAIRLSLEHDQSVALAPVARHRGLHDGLRGLFRELRLHGDPDAVLAALTGRGEIPRAAVSAYRRYVGLVDSYHDAPGLAHQAAARAEAGVGPWTESLGALVVYLPSRLDAATALLLSRLGRWLPVLLAVPHLGEDAADALLTEAAGRLAAEFGVVLGTSPDNAPITPADLDIISAPDPAEEVRTAVRRVAGDLEAGVPLWQIAVLYADEETYGGQVREALAAASFPWHAATGRSLIGFWAARSLLGLLALPERRFAREAVLEWLSGRPPGDDDDSTPLPKLSISTWDRLSRQAQVFEGPRQWAERLGQLARSLETAEGRRDDNEDAAADAGGDSRRVLPGDAAAALAIARAITQLAADTAPPNDGSSWDAFVDWAAGLKAQYVATSPTWPAAELAASAAVDTALESLREASTFEPAADLRTFRDALAGILDIRRRPEGEAGQGVLVGPVSSALGAAFQRLYMLGMSEGALPSRPSSDPLAATDGSNDPLGRQERVREGDRRAFLGALSAADGARATLSYARSDGGAQATYPSRWLLERVSALEGRAVYASDLAVLLAVGRPWLLRVASLQDGAARVAAGSLPAADLADRRMASVVSWRNQHGDLRLHPLAVRPDLPLGASLRASRARRSRAFTPYDGNLAELAGASTLMARAFDTGKVSATSIQRWATCHFQYLLQDVLRVRATRRPEDEWTVSALDRGGLVHLILERFFKALANEKRLRNGDRLTPADHDRLDEIALAAFAERAAGGRTGHPLAWENAQSAILTDLHELLERDQVWRDAEGLVPVRFEQTFGRPDDPDTWPAVDITLADGRTVAFGGVIDRIDKADGQARRALIIDYKSGGSAAYRVLEQDPLGGGRQVQLAVYAQAMRNEIQHRSGNGDAWQIESEFRFVTARGGFKRATVEASPQVEERLGQVLQWVADGVGGGAFLPTPGARDRGSFENCTYCDYDRVCASSRDESWERKHGVLQPLDGDAL